MKKIFLLFFAIAAFAGSMQAQLMRNTFFAGGSLGFGSTTDKSTVGSTTNDVRKSNRFNFTPAVGYMITDRWAAGIILSYDMTKTTTYPGGLVDERTETTTTIGAGVFGRRYFMFTESLGLTGTLGLLGLGGGTKTEERINTATVTTETTRSGMLVALSGGGIWFPTPHIGLETSVGILSFSSTKDKVNGSDPEAYTTSSNMNFDLSSFNLNIGFFYYF